MDWNMNNWKDTAKELFMPYFYGYQIEKRRAKWINDWQPIEPINMGN